MAKQPSLKATALVLLIGLTLLGFGLLKLNGPKAGVSIIIGVLFVLAATVSTGEYFD